MSAVASEASTSGKLFQPDIYAAQIKRSFQTDLSAAQPQHNAL
jgi:hypothetical protein